MFIETLHKIQNSLGALTPESFYIQILTSPLKELTRAQFLSLEPPAQRLAYTRKLTIYRGGIIPPPSDYLPFKKLDLTDTIFRAPTQDQLFL